MSNYYLVWSHQHGAWWGPGGHGYTLEVRAAGRFTREKAIQICRDAMPGQYRPGGALAELPIAEADLEEMFGHGLTEAPTKS